MQPQAPFQSDFCRYDIYYSTTCDTALLHYR